MKTVEFIAPGMAIRSVNAEGKILYHEVVEKLRKKFDTTVANEQLIETTQV